MKPIITLLSLALLAGCAAQDEKSTADTTQAVRDFIELRELEAVDQMRTSQNDGWTVIDDRFILYRARNDTYLVEFTRRCHELRDNSRITADKRWDNNFIRARFDTLRGCRIAAIYGLTEEEIVELQNIGESPGSRN